MYQVGSVDQVNAMSFEYGSSKGCDIVAFKKPQEAERPIRELQNVVSYSCVNELK